MRLGAALSSPWGLPHDASFEGYRVDRLMQLSLVLCGVIFVAACGWLLYCVIRYGERREAVADHGTSRRATLTALGLALSVFLIVDGSLFVRGALDARAAFFNFDEVERDADAIRVEVNAHQWAWDARQPGPDGKFDTPDDIVTSNEIRVPVGAPVLFQVASTDVIHSFNLPNFRVKVDAVPGRLSRLWIRARDEGEYEIGCAQHCGTNHYKMRGRLVVLSRQNYARWAAEAAHVSARAFDARDESAHWGWAWETP